MKTAIKSRPVTLSNPRTGEIWICPDFVNRRVVDGVEFVQVHKPDNPRLVWISLDSVVRNKR
jgi:hypothetical protein